MRRSVILRRAACLLTVLSPLASQPAAQDKPDFTGTWVLESGASAADVPQDLVINQSLSRTNVRGAPMQPFFREITITRTLATGTPSETYAIGIAGGTISGVGPGVWGASTHHQVVWEEQSLVIDSGSFTGPLPETGDWAERREVWSLDSSMRLHLAITTSSSVDAPTSVELTYRRQR